MITMTRTRIGIKKISDILRSISLRPRERRQRFLRKTVKRKYILTRSTCSEHDANIITIIILTLCFERPAFRTF